jgi:glycosyltransferase involved in cell wall biosynthesis
MRIGFSAFVMQAGRSGVAAYIKELFANLQGVDADRQYTLMMPRGEDHLIALTAPNFEKRISPACTANPLLSLAWHNLCLPSIARREKFDLIHIPSYRRIPFVKSARLVATVHDLATFALDAKYDRARMFFNRRIVPAMIRRADRIITVSNYTKRDIVRIVGYPEDRIDVVYSGIDTELFAPRARRQWKCSRARTEFRNPSSSMYPDSSTPPRIMSA